MPPFETAQLLLRPAAGSDIDQLHALWTDAEVRKHLWDDEIIPRETVEEVVNASIESFVTNNFGQWAIRERGHDDIIGFCGLRFIDETGIVEILYGFLPAYWGKGYATEAATVVLDHGFRTAGLTEIVAEMDPPNRASIRVAEKLGMRFVTEYVREGLPTLRYARSARPS
jgi:[ribosomal protein S5]-alanine N-acetyltransferase